MMSKSTIFEMLGLSLAFLGIGVAYFAIHLGMRQERLKRELEHRERMRALDLGRPLPGDVSWLSPLRIGFLIGLLVPVAAMGCACLATISTGYHPDLWQAAGIVSVFGVVCGTVIVSMAAGRQAQAGQAGAALARKPAIEEDAYDVVSARG
ncbi:MAG: hypothetical protein U0790_14200 [Isosphaeraceae bacterium]